MKWLVIIQLVLVNSTAFSQIFGWGIDFEDTNTIKKLFIDTIVNSNNTWQIGPPNKTLFDGAYSQPNVIVTDTINSYPANDTSSFVITHYRFEEGSNEFLLLDFWYKMDSDSGSDYGMIEVSVDAGQSWINLMTEDVFYQFYWQEPKPTLSGLSTGWRKFSLEMSNLTYNVGFSDSLLYRFTFVSDSVQSNKEGWMIDEIFINDSWEGIKEQNPKNVFTLHPNPTSGLATITNTQQRISNVEVYDVYGRLVPFNFDIERSLLDIRHSPPGIYFIKLVLSGVEGVGDEARKLVLSKKP